MTNGDVIAGSTTQVNVYPKMKLNGTKALTGRALKDGEFKFQLLKQGTKSRIPRLPITSCNSMAAQKLAMGSRTTLAVTFSLIWAGSTPME